MALSKYYLGDLITQRREKNPGGDLPIRGVSKEGLQPPKQIDADTSIYNLYYRNDFVYNPARMELGSIAFNDEYDQAICSSLYEVFFVHRTDLVIPEYLALFVKHPEFARYCNYIGNGSAREYCRFDNISGIPIYLPPIYEQSKIVHDYQVITDRIELLQKTNDILDEFLMSLYAKKIDENDQVKDEISLGDLCLQITDGKHGDCTSEENSGYYFVSVKDIINGDIDFGAARQITRADYEETHRRTKLEVGDTLFTNSGTLGKMCFIMSEDIAKTTTFQKSVAIIKPDTDKILPRTLFLTLAFNKKKLVDLAHGSAQLNLLLGDMRDFKIKVPSFKLQKNFETMVKPAFNLLQQHRDEIVELRRIRNLISSFQNKGA